MTATDRPTTRICSHTAEAIYIRGRDLVEDMIGRMTFTEMTYFTVMGRTPSGAEAAILDAVLVTLMEHWPPWSRRSLRIPRAMRPL